MKRHNYLKSIILYIVLIFIALFAIFPFLWGLSGSFRSDTEMYQYMLPFSIHTLIPVHFTFDSYTTLFTDLGFGRPFMNTIVVTFVSIFFGCIINSIAAFAFAAFDFKFKKILYSIVLFSFMIPFEAIAIPLYSVANGLNLVDTYAGIILPSLADGLVMFLFVQFFKSVPQSILEAARVDGASWIMIFAKIVAPLSVPVFITAGLMIFMGQWNSYLWPLLVARSRDIQMVQIALASFRTEHATMWSSMYAGSMISALIPLFLFLPLQKYFVQGITSSGVKG